jgi:hypothetical protein
LRAARVQLLDDYRAQNARALHIKLNGQGDTEIDTIISVLNHYQSSDAIPLVFHMHREDYAYQLRTNGDWSLKPDEQCLLELQRCLDKSEFYFEYP